MLLPLPPGTQLFMLFYNGYQYLVFSGNVDGMAYGEDEAEAGSSASR